MTTLREAAQQALEALSCIEYEICGITDGPSKDSTETAITALRAALAEPVQKPVAWISESENLLSWDKFYDHMKPLYTAPPQRKPLTDEEIDKITVKQWGRDFMAPAAGRTWARAIERAHGIGGDE